MSSVHYAGTEVVETRNGPRFRIRNGSVWYKEVRLELTSEEIEVREAWRFDLF